MLTMKSLKQAVVLALLGAAIIVGADPNVYVTKAGKHYHRTETCWSLSRSKSVTPVSLAEAKKRGLEPCKLCWREAKPESK